MSGVISIMSSHDRISGRYINCSIVAPIRKETVNIFSVGVPGGVKIRLSSRWTGKKVNRCLTRYGRLVAVRTVEELVVTQTSFTAAEEDFRSIFLLHTFTPVRRRRRRTSDHTSCFSRLLTDNSVIDHEFSVLNVFTAETACFIQTRQSWRKPVQQHVETRQEDEKLLSHYSTDRERERGRERRSSQVRTCWLRTSSGKTGVQQVTWRLELRITQTTFFFLSHVSSEKCLIPDMTADSEPGSPL